MYTLNRMFKQIDRAQDFAARTGNVFRATSTSVGGAGAGMNRSDPFGHSSNTPSATKVWK